MDRQWTDNGPIMSGNFGLVVVVLVVVVDVVEGLDAIRVDLRGLDDFWIGFPMERAVGKLHDIDSQEDDEAEFKDAGETSKETVNPAQMNCMKQFGEERTEDW